MRLTSGTDVRWAPFGDGASVEFSTYPVVGEHPRPVPRRIGLVLALRGRRSADRPPEGIRASLRYRHGSRPVWHGSVPGVDTALGNLHLVVLAAVLIGADTADEIAVRLGLDVDAVAILIAELQQFGALTVVPRS